MKMEVRNDGLHITGYVNAKCRFSRELPSPRGKFVEQVEDGVWQRALDNADNVDLLFNHNETRKLGSTKDGNLTLEEDSIGLRAECVITDEEVITKAKNKELRGWSFKFSINKDNWTENDGTQQRYLKDINLYEVSILSVTPAYQGTSIEARGEESIITEERSVEEKSELIEEVKIEKKVEDKVVDNTEELRCEQNKIAYNLLEQEIEILKLKA
ncbi:HK97 family phage prohead protease [Clostridium estertheticum]|uniref:HK97 family phage prohead protease n=1 Tax=Clostridium estertheticum TaxID=238834 RepID=UPI001C6F181B|nr:HK97 family phage prohead protease [Clostridium estertheticum]MBW9170772.1 HK97 family phage prohead protease [Clostridium estertheticum]WLC74389.1 HK97 family phage prohead protease [Clostridium estertheticum]